MSKAFLQIVSGARQGLTIPLQPNKPLLIGRKRGDLKLDDPLVSGQHCRISYNNKRYVLHDLRSTNGTTVDGRLVRECVLRPGAEITVGNNRLILFMGDEADDVEPAGV